MMNLIKLFFAVVTAHLALIGVLFFLPGCQTLEEGASSSPKETSAYSDDEDQSEATYTSINDEISVSSSLRRPPTRPTWNLSNTAAQSVSEDASGVLEPVSPEYDLPPVSASSGISYTVQKGDTLWGLSHRYDVSVSAIASASGINAKKPLKVGQQLTIPSVSSAISSQPLANQGEASYTVRKGDTLSGIAARSGTTVSALKQVNGLQSSTIRVGQTLTLPSASSSVSKKESVPSVAVAPKIKGDTYTVARGDTLSGIAKRTGVSVSDLIAINGMDDPSQLQVGQVLALKGNVSKSLPVKQPAVEVPSDDVFDSAEDVPVVETVVIEEDEYSDDFGDDSVFDSVDEVSVVPVDGATS